MAPSSGNSSVQSRPGRERAQSEPPSTRTWARMPSNFTSSVQSSLSGTLPERASIGSMKRGGVVPVPIRLRAVLARFV